jgi:hypothetical protein
MKVFYEEEAAGKKTRDGQALDDLQGVSVNYMCNGDDEQCAEAEQENVADQNNACLLEDVGLSREVVTNKEVPQSFHPWSIEGIEDFKGTGFWWRGGDGKVKLQAISVACMFVKIGYDCGSVNISGLFNLGVIFCSKARQTLILPALTNWLSFCRDSNVLRSRKSLTLLQSLTKTL